MKFLLSIFTLIIASLPRVTIADDPKCDCLPVSSVVEAKKSASIVFAGKVSEKTRVSLDPLNSNYKAFKVTFRLIKYWKGNLAWDTTIWTAEAHQDCGIDFVKGQSYLVYAMGAGLPMANSCMRIVPWLSKQSEDDVARLGNSKFPDE